MKALVYRGHGNKVVEDRPKPDLQLPSDAILRITKTTICGTDLHILKGDVATSANRVDDAHALVPQDTTGFTGSNIALSFMLRNGVG